MVDMRTMSTSLIHVFILYFCILFCFDRVFALDIHSIENHQHQVNQSIYSRQLFDAHDIPVEYRNGNGSHTVFLHPDLDNARRRTHVVMNLIYQRFEYHNWYWYQFFLGSFNMPTTAWDILKYKIAKKSMDALATGKKQEFLMIFGGSSVTAGHDNYFYQSYPMIFHRRVKPILDALGIELFVRNIAQGQNQCRPSDLCYEAMGGSNPDWIGWEQSYNCKSGDIMEIIARTALINKAIAFYTASGAFVPEECGDDNDTIPWISEQWTPEKVNLHSKFIPTKEYVENLRSTLDGWYQDGNAVNRFTSLLKGKYDGVAPHGFSVWGHSKRCRDVNNTKTFGCDAINMRPPCFDQGGAHWMSKQAAAYGVTSNKRTFHPSIGIHMLRGETMAFNYIAAILDAIHMMEDDMAKKISYADAAKEYQKKLDELQTPGPDEPVHCNKEECWTRARCWTNYLPHYNSEYLLDNILVGNHEGWNLVQKSQGYQPKWGYLDYRPAYDARGGNLEIHVKIDIRRDNSLVITCGYFAKDSLKYVQFYLDENAPNANALYVPNPSRKKLTNLRHHKDGDECVYLYDIPKGIHVLSIITDSEQSTHLASLTHVITFE